VVTPLRVLLAVPVVLLATALVALCWPDAGPAAPTAPTAPTARVAPVASVATSTAATTDPAVEVLRTWDLRRAAAWSSADPGALRRLYTPGSRTGRGDVALLGAYAARGVDVAGLRMQLLAVHVLERTAGRVVLVVTDRLAQVEASHDGRPLALPSDLPSTHRVELVRAGETWLVAEVAPARPPAQPAR